MILQRIPARYFEAAGTFFGLLASVTIAAQVYAEYATDTPSTLSLPYALGFGVIFAFWTLYGLRFGRPALWITNGIAVAMQLLLVIVALAKQP